MNDLDDHQRRQRSAEFRFYEELNDFLPAGQRKVGFDYFFHGTPSVRDAIQAIGVPHTAIDLVLVDGRSVDFHHQLQDGERVAVYPAFERLDISPLIRLRAQPLRRTRFILDVHLGKLARYLRMLGFDAAYAQNWDDETIIDLSLAQKRIILTRDIGILKQNRVTHGYWLRHHQPVEQLQEVLQSLDLAHQLKPFTRCMECNGAIHRVDKADLGSEVEAAILARFDSFWRCRSCRKVYWQGSHYREMLQRVTSISSDALIRQLQDPQAYPHDVRDIKVIETHISWVILTGDYAYKIKKPLKLGFLDFSTLDRRKFYCEEELRVNRRTAPELYLDVVGIGVSQRGMCIGAEPALEYAVRMRQFPHESRLDRCLQAGLLAPGHMCRLAAMIARFHMGLPPREHTESGFEFERAVKPARNNFLHLDADLFSDESQQQLAVIEDWSLQQAEALEPVFEARARHGFIRECHGDLHLENLLLQEDRFTLFDALEFNANLRWIDTANDIAFLVMDLMAHQRGDLAFALLNAWLEETGDYESPSVMRFYLVYRAMVRAVVTSIRQQQNSGAQNASFRLDAARYVELAARLVDALPPRLYLMHGFSGSGKTWISDRLVSELMALRVRSDLERKRLPDLPKKRSVAGQVGSGLYSPEITEQTYGKLAFYCETGLRAGFSMIADATFLRRRHRKLFFDLAKRTGAQLLIVDCHAPENLLRERIQQRSAANRDASDADLAVLEHQLAHYEGLSDSEKEFAVRICSSDDPEQIVLSVAKRCNEPPAHGFSK